MLPATNRVGTLVSGLLDKGYDQAAGAVLRSISSSVTSGIVAQRLNELDAEAARLAAAGESLRPDNPVLRALLADLEPVLQRNARRIDVGAEAVQANGVNAAGTLTRELALPGLTDQQLAGIGVRWNTPSADQVNELVGLVDSDAWGAEIDRYPDLVLETVRNQAIRGFASGWGPERIAREIRRVSQSMTVAQANNLLRTTQLTSYRRATAINQLENADVIDYIVRIATLDSRVCMSCVALHATKLDVGEVVQDHHQGRCVGVAVVKGRTLNIQTGEEWFNALPQDQQRAMMGPGAFDAWQAGRIQLSDFSRPYDDPTFGRMMRQSTLAEMLSGSHRAPSGQIATLNGYSSRDVGRPGNTEQSLTAFLSESRGPLASAIRDIDAGLVELDWGTDEYTVRPDGVRDAARRFVQESLDTQYGRDYLASLAQEQARASGVVVDIHQAEQLLNQQYAHQSQAILETARIGNVRLTEAQLRRLTESSHGQYLDLVYTRDNSERGSLANAASRRRGASSSGVILEERRRLFREYVQGVEV